MVLKNLHSSHSGSYTCLATNLVGTVSHMFSLRVEQAEKSVVQLPSVKKMSNNSVIVGEDCILECQVTSSLYPSIQWLKEVEKEGSLHLAGMNLVNVGDGQTVRISEDDYINTIVIESVTVKDSGFYVCFVTNNAGGFNYKSSFITVLPQSEDIFLAMEENQIVMTISMGLVSFVLLVVFLMFFCFIKSRNLILKPEYSESQRSIIYQKNTLDHNSWVTKEVISCSTDFNGTDTFPKHLPCQNNSNIYDLPFSHSRNPPQYTPLLQSTQSPCSTRVSRVSSLPSSSVITPKNNRRETSQIIKEYQNL